MLSNLLNKRQTYAIIAIGVGFGGLVWIMNGLGLFDVDGTEPNANVVAAALALVGAYLGGALSVVGIVIKGALDEQTERRLILEAQRNADLKAQEERRLTIEAATSALQLCGTSSGNPTQPVQREGALYLLTSLDQHQLAVELVSSLISRNEVSASAASMVLDAALRRGTDETEISAVNVVYANAAKFLSEEGVHCPLTLQLWSEEWAARTSPYVRDLALDAMCCLLLARSMDGWRKHGAEEAYSLVAAICRAWQLAPKGSAERSLVARRLKHVLAAFPETRKLGHPTGLIDTAAIRAELATAVLDGLEFDLLDRLERWSTPAFSAELPLKSD